jgi:uncharacterized membrane protein
MLIVHVGGGADSHQGYAMRVKAIAVLVIVAASAGVFMAMHKESRADAANGNCYAAAEGPSTPTICG